MQLKKSYYIATNVCSRKGAITFGDLPDCLDEISRDTRRSTFLMSDIVAADTQTAQRARPPIWYKDVVLPV